MPHSWREFWRDSLPAAVAGLSALAVRLLYFNAFAKSVLYLPPPGSGHDRSLYAEAIKAATQGRFLPDGALEFLPLYPWLAGILQPVFGSGPAAAATFGIICDVLTILLIVALARRLGASRLASALAGLAYAFYPLACVYSLLTMPNTLNALGLTLFAFAGHALLEKSASAQTDAATPSRPPWPFAALGLLGGALSLGFAGLIPIGFALAALAGLRTRSWKIPALLLAGWFLPLLPVAWHNSRVEGSFVLLTTHGGFNVYMGNHERATGYPLRVQNFRMTAREMLADAHRYAEQASGRTLSRAESSAWWKQQARAFWRNEPTQAALLTLKKIALFWNFREVDDLRMREQLAITSPFFRHMPGTPFWLIALCGLTGLLFIRRAAAPRVILLTGMAGLVLFFITARYRLTFVPLLAAFGAAGVTHLAQRWREGNARTSLALLPLAAFVFIPFSIRDQRPVDHYNVAVQLIAADRKTEAMEVIERGLAIDPNASALHFARGNLLFSRGEYAPAAASYSRAQALDDANPQIYYNLALSLARLGEYCSARDALAQAQQKGMHFEERTVNLLKELTAACGGM